MHPTRLNKISFWLGNVLQAKTACNFFNIATAKSVPNLSIFFLARLLPNALRTKTACTFSTAQLPRVVRARQVLALLTSKCASRHNNVQFSSLIWPDGSAPAALDFSTLRSHRSPLGKQGVSRLCYLFAHLHLLSSDSSSFLSFFRWSSFLFSSLLWLFPPPYCRKFDSSLDK